MRFYLGTHCEGWLATAGVPLFVSHRRLRERKHLPVAAARWALDSGAFTEIKDHGRFTFTEADYVTAVVRYRDEIGMLDWVAPMDWMCEPFILEKTGLTVPEHQRRTVANFLRLRDELGPLVVPVLQGYTVDDYLFCAEFYYQRGIELHAEPVVGVGSVCRRHSTDEVAGIFSRLSTRLGTDKMHGFGVKSDGLYRNADRLASADSMAWSSAGRRDRIRGHAHKNCANCFVYAMRWRDRLLNRTLAQERMLCAA